MFMFKELIWEETSIIVLLNHMNSLTIKSLSCFSVAFGRFWVRSQWPTILSEVFPQSNQANAGMAPSTEALAENFPNPFPPLSQPEP